MKLLKFIEFINESYKEKISKENLDFFTTQDPSRTKKYVEWCAKQLISDENLDRDDIIGLVKWFDTNLPRLENKDIYAYNYETLRELYNLEGESKTKLNSLNSEDFSTVVDNSEIKIVYIKTFKAAEKWNAVNPNGGRSWCIGRNASTFDDYCRTSTFYYIWLGKYRFCVQVKNSEIIVWNSYDQSSSLDSHKELKKYQNSFKFIKLSLKTQLLKLKHTILKDGTYHFHCTVDVSEQNLKSLKDLEIEISKVDGYFICSYNQLTTLEGSPKSVVRSFNCSYNQLTTLEGSPKSVVRSFYCSNNKLTTLEGSPKTVGGDFSCYNNKLTTLEGSPKTVGGGFSCSNNQLTTLLGSPKSVGEDFYCDNNKLTTLEGSPKTVGEDFECNNNQLTTLEGSPKTVSGSFICFCNQLTTLEGSPKSVGGDFYCRGNKLTTLEGSPETVGGGFDCSYNKLPKNITKPKGLKGDFIK